MNKLLLILFFGYILSQLYAVFNLRIIKSPIINGILKMNLHHIIVLSNRYNNTIFYTVDFSPKHDNSFFKTALPLLLGRSIPGKLRVNVFYKPLSDKEIINSVYSNKNDNEMTLYEMYRYDTNISKYMKNVINWDTNMNLYSNNCRHFSYFCKQLYTCLDL